jgi:hypothetical protein
VAYALSGRGQVTVRIYNGIGTLVDVIVDSRPAGWQSSQVDVGRFASGPYYFLVYVNYDSGASDRQGPGKFYVLH